MFRVKDEFRGFNNMPMDRAGLVELKAKLRNAQNYLMDAASAYEAGGSFADAQRCRHRARNIAEEIEAANEHLAALPAMPKAARAQ
jgi:hypothetical protein